MVKIGIITGSTRDSRVNLQVAEWVKSIADKRTDAEFELVDIKDYNLPKFNEPIPAIMSQDYQAPEAHAWSEKLIVSTDLFLSHQSIIRLLRLD